MSIKNNINFTTFLGIGNGVVLTLVFASIIFNCIFIESSSDIIFFGFIGVYIGAVFFYSLHSKITFLFCLTLLIIMFIEFLFTGSSLKTEKAGVWFVLFMAIGIIQQWKE